MGKTQLKYFHENQDFILLTPSGEQKSGSGGHNKKDYLLSLDMAKHVALMSKTKKGHEVRTYFIQCEKKLRQIDEAALRELMDDLQERLACVDRELEMKDLQLEDIISDLTAASAKANIVDDTYADPNKRLSIHEFARTMISVNSLMIKKSLADLGYFYKAKGRYRVHYKFRNSYFVEKRDRHGNYDIYPTWLGERLVDGLYRSDKLLLKKGELSFKQKEFTDRHLGCGFD